MREWEVCLSKKIENLKTLRNLIFFRRKLVLILFQRLLKKVCFDALMIKCLLQFFRIMSLGIFFNGLIRSSTLILQLISQWFTDRSFKKSTISNPNKTDFKKAPAAITIRDKSCFPLRQQIFNEQICFIV